MSSGKYRPLAIKELKQFQRFLSKMDRPFYPVACKGKFEYARFEPTDMIPDDYFTPIIFYFRSTDNLEDKNQTLSLAPYHKDYINQFEEWKKKEE